MELKFKGDVEVQKLGPTDWEVLEEGAGKTLKVSESFTYKGVDLSHLVGPNATEEEIADATDKFKDELQKGLSKKYQSMDWLEEESNKFDPDTQSLIRSKYYLGSAVDVTHTGPPVLTPVDLQSCSFMIEFIAYFDLPVRDLSDLLKDLAATLV